MERAVVLFAILHFVIVGLSHIARPYAWVRFFERLREHGDAGVFLFAFLTLWFGTIIVVFHNVWSGIPLLLTVFGWGQVAKALIYFLFPEFALRRFAFIRAERAWVFRVGGVFLVSVGALLAYDLAN